MVFVHTGRVNFDLNKCSLFIEYCFQLSRRFIWSELLLVRFPLPKISHPPTGGISPVGGWEMGGGRWGYIHTSKTSEGGNIFLRKQIIYKSVIKNNTTSKRKASSQCHATLSAGGGRGAEKRVILAKREEELNFLNF